MSLATDGFSAMINVFPMALAGWVYQSPENALKFSFSNGGNVAEKTVEVKAGKFLVAAGCRLQFAVCSLQVAGGPLREAAETGNPQPTIQGEFKNGSRRRKEADFGAKNISACYLLRNNIVSN